MTCHFLLIVTNYYQQTNCKYFPNKNVFVSFAVKTHSIGQLQLNHSAYQPPVFPQCAALDNRMISFQFVATMLHCYCLHCFRTMNAVNQPLNSLH